MRGKEIRIWGKGIRMGGERNQKGAGVKLKFISFYCYKVFSCLFNTSTKITT